MSRRITQKAETRAAILQAARQLFDAGGFEATTTRDIATRAGVATGTVFAHFPDKQAILAAALHDQIEAALAQAVATLPRAGLEDQLVHLATALYAGYAARPALSRVLVRESLFGAESGRPLLDGQLDAFFGYLAGLFSAAKVRGELRADVDEREAAFAWFALYFAVLVGGLRGDLPAEAQAPLLARLTRAHLPPPDGSP
jgi:AcrR family transcriptional regulator